MSTCASTDPPDKEYETFVTGHRDKSTGRVTPPRVISCPECGNKVRKRGKIYRCGCGAETTLELPEEK